MSWPNAFILLVYKCVPHSCSPWHSPLHCLGKCFSGFSVPVLVIYRLQTAPFLQRPDSFTPASPHCSYMPTPSLPGWGWRAGTANSLRSTTFQADPHLLWLSWLGMASFTQDTAIPSSILCFFCLKPLHRWAYFSLLSTADKKVKEELCCSLRCVQCRAGTLQLQTVSVDLTEEINEMVVWM